MEFENKFFRLEETLRATVCGCIIGSKQSVYRFRIAAEVVGDMQACSTALYLKGAIAEAAVKSWYITIAVWGKADSRATLVDKFIERTKKVRFGVEEWERLFVKATMVKQDIKIKEPRETRTLELSAY